MFVLGLMTARVRSASVLRACLVGLVSVFFTGFLTRLDTLWLAAFGTLVTIAWGLIEACFSPASAAEQADKVRFTWAGRAGKHTCTLLENEASRAG